MLTVEFERSGGFAGRRMTARLEGVDLPPGALEELESLLAQADFFALPEILENPGGTDRFVYRLSVEAGDQQHRVEAGEAAVPENLWPLLNWLTDRARGRSSDAD